jgi:OOP family OmpA-OmpF porin
MKAINLLLAVAFFCSSGISVSFANEQDGQWYVNGMVSYINPDSERELKDGVAGGQVTFGRAMSEFWNAEVEVDYLDVDGQDGSPGTTFAGGAVNGLWMWNREGFISPYLLGGIGGTYTDYGIGGTTTDWRLQGGPGIMVDLFTERLAVRAELLGRWADRTDLIVNLGLQFSFGKKKSVPVAAAAAAAVIPSDSDGDGVVDDTDQCPGTAAGVVVDASGCGIDSDGDGVFDGLDQCPNTIQGALVDSVGCGYQLTGAHYQFDSDELNSDAKGILDEVADRLGQATGVSITIEGYTDSRGDDDYNLGLSQRRADSAGDYLVSRGVAGSRISTIGMGEKQPVASNDTDEGRAANRRVVLKVDD